MPRGRFETARGQLDVAAAQGILDVLHGDAARRHGAAVEPDADGKAALAVDLDLTDAGHGREALDDGALGKVGEFGRR